MAIVIAAISASDDSRDFVPTDLANMSLAHKHTATEGMGLQIPMKVRTFVNETTKKQVISLTADSVLAVHAAIVAALAV